MPAQPLNIQLSDGQKIEALKRFRARYHEELAKIEVELTEILTGLAEADFLGQYLGEQPEVTELRSRKAEADKLEKRRQHLTMIVERLDQVIPKQDEVKVPPPNQGAARPTGTGGARPPGGLRRY